MKHASVSSTDQGGGNSVRHGELSAVSTVGQIRQIEEGSVSGSS